MLPSLTFEEIESGKYRRTYYLYDFIEAYETQIKKTFVGNYAEIQSALKKSKVEATVAYKKYENSLKIRKKTEKNHKQYEEDDSFNVVKEYQSYIVIKAQDYFGDDAGNVLDFVNEVINDLIDTGVLKK